MIAECVKALMLYLNIAKERTKKKDSYVYCKTPND